MSPRGYVLSESGRTQAQEIARRVLGQGTSTAGSRRKTASYEEIRYVGKLDEALEAGSLDAPTTATMTVWGPDPDSEAEHPPWIATELTLTVVNRDESLEGEEGALIKVEWLQNEWSPYWVSC